MSRDPTPLSQVLPKTSSRFAAMLEGSRVEIAQDSWKISRQIGGLIKHGGAGLVVDYGGPQLFGSSFRVSFQDPSEAGQLTLLTDCRDFAIIKSPMSLINLVRPT